MLGYFRILGVQVLTSSNPQFFVLIRTFFFKESRVLPNDLEPPLEDRSELMTGRVRWRFRLRWSPGGEEWILPNHNKDFLEHPWWKPPSPRSLPPLEEIASLDTQAIVLQDILARTPPLVASTFEPQVSSENDRTTPYESESTFDTTPLYREARLSNVNYEFRDAHFRERYHSLVPLQLLAPYGHTVLDTSFPRGWLCETCGKMNFQAALRHRVCSSSFCKVWLVFFGELGASFSCTRVLNRKSLLMLLN